MAVTLGSNVWSLRAVRQLDGATSELRSVFERLSTGQRINRASDDAAGLAIAESLRAADENFQAAEGRIRDADITTESSRMIRLNILRETASSVLAQANQQPALALTLLS